MTSYTNIIVALILAFAIFSVVITFATIISLLITSYCNPFNYTVPLPQGKIEVRLEQAPVELV